MGITKPDKQDVRKYLSRVLASRGISTSYALFQFRITLTTQAPLGGIIGYCRL